MRTAMALGRLSRRPWYSSMLLLSRYTLLISCESCWSSCAAQARRRAPQPPRRTALGSDHRVRSGTGCSRTPGTRRARLVTVQQRHARGVRRCAVWPKAKRRATRARSPFSTCDVYNGCLSRVSSCSSTARARKHTQQSTTSAVNRRAALWARWAAGAHPAHVVLEHGEVLQDVVLDRAHIRRADLPRGSQARSAHAWRTAIPQEQRRGVGFTRLATHRRALPVSMFSLARALRTTQGQAAGGAGEADRCACRQGRRTRCC